MDQSLQFFAGAQVFLNIPGKPGGNIMITDNPTSSSLASGNQAKIARRLDEGLHGFNQQVGTNVEFLNPNSPDGKDPVNVLVHEIGHMKWPGLGNEDRGHDPLFYRLLNDSLSALTLPVDKQLDLNGVDIDDVASPAGSDPLRYNITPSVRSPLAAPSPRSSIGPSPQAVPPGGNPPAAAPPSANIVPPQPRVLQSPRNSGQPLDIRPPAQSGTQGPVGPAPSPPLPPLHFAPEPPQDFGPFTPAPQPTSGSSTPAINGVAGDGAASPFAATPGLDQSSPDTRSKKPMRYLSGRVVGAPWAWAFDAGAPAVPFVVTDNPLAPAPPASFNDHFGGFASSPSPAARQPAQSDGSARPDLKAIRVLSSRFPMLNHGGVALGNSPSPGAPNPSSVQNGWPPATQPLPDFLVPPSVYGLPDRSAGSKDDWFDRWIKPLFQQ